MSNQTARAFQLDWFNVTYRSVAALVFLCALVIGGVVGVWYYFRIHQPQSSAQHAIADAERRYAEASPLKNDPALVEIVANAEGALREAREAFNALRYDPARVAAIRSENFSLQALRMAGGSEDSETPVHFYRIEGDVRVKRAGEFSWNPANPKMLLKVGDQVKTSSSGSGQLIYFDGTMTTIQPGSLLEIRDLYEDPVTKVRRVREKLNWGELNASTQKRNVAGSFHEVSTDKAAARAEEAGEFRVEYDKKSQQGSFDVFEGRIEVASGSRRENLVAGEGIKATGNKLSSKLVLPATPRLLAPRDQRVFTSDTAPDITLSWEPVAGAASYHLIISDKSLFTDSLFDSSIDGTSAFLEAVPESAYYWKVAGVASGGLEGQFSDPRRFRVSGQKIRDKTDDEPPVLEITEFVPIGLMVIVNGRTEPGASLWVDEEKIDVDDSGTFYAVIRMRKEGVNELNFVAQDAAGNETRLVKSTYVELY